MIPFSVDVKFNSNSRPRGKLGQVGSSYRYSLQRPILQRLFEYEYVTTYDSTVASCLDILVNVLVSSLGEIEHPDPDIQAYCRYNVSRLGEEEGLIDFDVLLSEIIHSTLWAGFSVSEKLFEVVEGTLLLKDIVSYHPSSITIKPNKQGRLTEGEATLDVGGGTSGIYQATFDNPEKRLDLWKIVYLANNKTFGNFYGRSVIESAIYKWHLLKEGLIDSLATSIDRNGNPLLAITMPVQTTSATERDPQTGELRYLTTQELLQNQLNSSATTLGGGNVIYLPQTNPDMKPEIKNITSGTPPADIFLKPIQDLCDLEIVKCLLIPFVLQSANVNLPQTAVERQVEIFNRILGSMHKRFIRPAAAQIFKPLINFSFPDRPLRNISPTFPLQNTVRAEDRVALMQMISGLTASGYLNPTNEIDFRSIRRLVNIIDRPFEPEDLQFVKDMLINPKLKTEAGGVGKKTSGARVKTTKPRDRTSEGKVKGTGGKGRPTGTSNPQNKPRE